MFVVAYLWTLVLVFAQVLPYGAIIVLLSIPYAYKAVLSYRNKSGPGEMMPAMKAVAQTNTFFGLLLAIGLLI
jgi:1,4-dihydroxy-2-naphthoate octaprenyltransferase